MRIIDINPKSSLPKYKQIITSIEKAIAEKRLSINERLPSVNKVCMEFSISRDTVLLAYDELKKRRIIYSILGKGYYVKSVDFKFEQRFFLLFDELNAFKEDLYNSLLKNIENRAQTDVFFHHFDGTMFKKLINESNGNYSKYIIMPSNLEGISDIINVLPKNDVYILDQTNDNLYSYPSVHQNFVQDMYQGLLQGKHLINKYKKLILVFPGFKEPIGMVQGFVKFCRQFNLNYETVSDFNEENILKGTLFIVVDDRHLVSIIEKGKLQNLVMGKDYGIISYNDMPLKKVVENGISTISTDFNAMGRLLVNMIFSNEHKNIHNVSTLIIRNSL